MPRPLVAISFLLAGVIAHSRRGAHGSTLRRRPIPANGVLGHAFRHVQTSRYAPEPLHSSPLAGREISDRWNRAAHGGFARPLSNVDSFSGPAWTPIWLSA